VALELCAGRGVLSQFHGLSSLQSIASAPHGASFASITAFVGFKRALMGRHTAAAAHATATEHT
jgi:hypothetical protein